MILFDNGQHIIESAGLSMTRIMFDVAQLPARRPTLSNRGALDAVEVLAGDITKENC